MLEVLCDPHGSLAKRELHSDAAHGRDMIDAVHGNRIRQDRVHTQISIAKQLFALVISQTSAAFKHQVDDMRRPLHQTPITIHAFEIARVETGANR